MIATRPMRGSSATSPGEPTAVLRRGLHVLRPVTRSLVIDAGCGAGRESARLALETGARVLALDRDPAALRAAPPTPGVQYVRADVTRLPLAADVAEAVYSFGLLQVLGNHGNEPIRAALREFRRALRPDGVAILSSIADFRATGGEFRSLTGAEVSQVMRGSFTLRELIGLMDVDARGHQSRYWYIHALPVPADDDPG